MSLLASGPIELKLCPYTKHQSGEDLVEIHLVDIAPAPMFSRFDGLHDRVPHLVEVGCGMAVPGGIATANLAAFQAHAQVHPAISEVETLVATPGVRRHLLYMIFYVRTLRGAHGILPFLA
jgi:hypothetical protein